jgi:hypothetical protein
MSDNWITLIPEDPRFVPDLGRQIRAKKRFAELATAAHEINIKVSDAVEFFDCGGNCERILCPECGCEVAVDWWQERMSEDYDAGFRLAVYSLPCCLAEKNLHELSYEWPQGFGRFALDAMNPNIGRLTEVNRQEFEQILGTPLRVIYKRI